MPPNKQRIEDPIVVDTSKEPVSIGETKVLVDGKQINNYTPPKSDAIVVESTMSFATYAAVKGVKQLHIPGMSRFNGADVKKLTMAQWDSHFASY